MIKSICVFCSSSNFLSDEFYSDARELGKLIGQNGFNFVYGGSTLGLMGEAAKSAKENGSHVLGIMPKKLCDLGVSSGNCDDFIMTEGMRDRKAKLDKMSDAIVALPGGFGTLEEISELIVQKQLGYTNKPIVFLNTKGFYNNLFLFFEDMIREKFAKEKLKNAYYIAKTPLEVIEYIKNYTPSDISLKFEDIHKNKQALSS